MVNISYKADVKKCKKKFKYRKGEFGYWWTRKNEDIEGGKYEGSICCPENLTSLRGA